MISYWGYLVADGLCLCLIVFVKAWVWLDLIVFHLEISQYIRKYWYKRKNRTMDLEVAGSYPSGPRFICYCSCSPLTFHCKPWKKISISILIPFALLCPLLHDRTSMFWHVLRYKIWIQLIACLRSYTNLDNLGKHCFWEYIGNFLATHCKSLNSFSCERTFGFLNEKFSWTLCWHLCKSGQH